MKNNLQTWLRPALYLGMGSRLLNVIIVSVLIFGSLGTGSTKSLLGVIRSPHNLAIMTLILNVISITAVTLYTKNKFKAKLEGVDPNKFAAIAGLSFLIPVGSVNAASYTLTNIVLTFIIAWVIIRLTLGFKKKTPIAA